MNIAVAIGGLAFLILIHEAGHFFVALAVKMRPRRFYIFFPPALFKRTHNGIEYGIGSIPLGGYVKIPGMHKPAAGDLDVHLGPARKEVPSLAEASEPVETALNEERLGDARAGMTELRAAVERAELSEHARRAADRGLTDIEDALSDDAYWRAPASKRIAVIAAGPATNLVFAILALAVVFMLGVPTGATRTVEEVVPGSPAASAGLQPGDEIVAVNGTEGEAADLAESIREGDGEPVTLTVERDGSTVTLEGTPQAQEDGSYRLGFAFGLEYESYGPLEAIGLAFETTWEVTKAIGRIAWAPRPARGARRGGERRRHHPGLERVPRGRVPLLPPGARVHQPLPRAPEPAPVPAARRRPHRVLHRRADPRPGHRSRDLRALLDRRDRAGSPPLLHRPVERHRPDPRWLERQRRAVRLSAMASERQIKVGNVPIGGGAPVVVQSMTLTKTHDVDATMAQIGDLVSAGCELVRVAVPKNEDAEALAKLVYLSPIPVIADIHFNASLALKAVSAGVAAVRINPGNIGGPDKVAEVVQAAKARGIPMRIGANSGSLPKHLLELAQEDTAEALVEEALEQVRLLESMDYYDFKISVKSSSVPTMIRAYRMLSEKVPYPLHLGVTEAGTPASGSIKSAIGVGSLLMDGIGDTIRISLTADPVEEVKVAWEILKALGLRERGPIMIACPSCGRDNVGVWNLAEAVEVRLREYPQAFEVAVMGCAVNGPGEAGDADFGVAGGRDTGFIYAHGRVLKKVESGVLVTELFEEIDRWIEGGMVRPKRLKLAKPAALMMAEAAQRPS